STRRLSLPRPSFAPIDEKEGETMMVTDLPGFQIKSATESDVSVILSFVKKLARYEQLLHEVVATEEVSIGYLETKPVGFVLFFHNYSTFLGKPGLYIEDLFVDEDYRRRGYGRAVLPHVAALARERGCGRLQWWVVVREQPGD